MFIYLSFILYLASFCTEVLSESSEYPKLSNVKKSRRILKGLEVGETRPYMVYLTPARTAGPELINSNWLCGGVIIHPQYILTSAACIEDVKHFYVVSGTHTWVPNLNDDECAKYGAKKAIWKCVPIDYVFDGKSFDNIQWLNNDIAVVKVEDEFNFEKRVRGCDFIPQMIRYNNQSQKLEKAKTVGTICGWGTTDRYVELEPKPNLRAELNSTELLETDVEIISKKTCKKRWNERYHNIIDNFMICSRDPDTSAMTALCTENVKCEEIDYDRDDDDDDDDEDKNKATETIDKTYRVRRVLVPKPDNLTIVGGVFRKANKIASGGFCQNDHGGPLIVGYGTTAVVIGVQSACQTQDPTQKCFGPFLYTSVWRNRLLISCAIYKHISPSCRRVFADSRTQTAMDWKNHPDGPAKNVLRESPSSNTELDPSSKDSEPDNSSSKHSKPKHSSSKHSKPAHSSNESVRLYFSIESKKDDTSKEDSD